MKKRSVIAALFIVLIAAGFAVAWFASARAKTFLKSGAALAVRSWRDIFLRSDGGAVIAEADFDGGSPATDTVAAADSSMAWSGADSFPESARKPVEVPPAELDRTTVQGTIQESLGDASSASNASPEISRAGSNAASAPIAVAPQPSDAGASVKNHVRAQVPLCGIPAGVVSAPSSSRKIILNEIAWMGSPPLAGESSSKASSREWIELRNISGGDVDVSAWQLLDADENIKIVFHEGEKIPGGGFYLLKRGDDGALDRVAEKTYTGILPNAGDALAIFDRACTLVDFLDARSGWPGGVNATKQTLERDVDAAGWHTSAAVGGTPGRENSVPPAPAAAPTPAPPLQQPASQQQYLVTVSFIGDGTGSVSSSPAGILCGFDCERSYASGTVLSFVAAPAMGSLFKGWSGPCRGLGNCVFTVTSSAAVLAKFDLIARPPAGESPPAPPPTPPPAPDAAPRLVIAEIQIAGAAKSNDFVKIVNPTAGAVNLDGWTLRKKSNTGAASPLREFPAGSVIAPGGSFLWANSRGGFGDSIHANATSTATLAAGNSVALFDAAGAIVDAVAWGCGANQYGEGAPYPNDPDANQVLRRKVRNGAIVDTDQNANDFTL